MARRVRVRARGVEIEELGWRVIVRTPVLEPRPGEEIAVTRSFPVHDMVAAQNQLTALMAADAPAGTWVAMRNGNDTVLAFQKDERGLWW